MKTLRKCVVCGKSDEKKKLFRFVKTGFELGNVEDFASLDVLGVKHGRGCYCHRDPKCLFSSKLVLGLFSSFFALSKAKKNELRRIYKNKSSEVLNRFFINELLFFDSFDVEVFKGIREEVLVLKEKLSKFDNVEKLDNKKIRL